MPRMLPMKRKVGAAKIRADSRTPRRLPMATSVIVPTQSKVRYGTSHGSADVTAAIPAATDTATVRV